MSYWEHEIGRSETAILNFKQIHLQSFIGTRESLVKMTIDKNFISLGHTNAVRSLCVLDDESTFLSGGRDQKLLVWKLENQNDNALRLVESAFRLQNNFLRIFRVESRWSYSNYRKSVFAISFLDSLRLAATCDGTIQVDQVYSLNDDLHFFDDQ